MNLKNLIIMVFKIQVLFYIYIVLQKHYAALKAIALDENKCEYNQETDDTFQPDEDSIHSNENIILPFVDSVKCSPDITSKIPLTAAAAAKSKTNQSTKRKRDYNNDNDNELEDNDKKRIKIKKEIIIPDITVDNAHTFTVPYLKAWLKEHNLPVTGKKGDLVDRIINSLNS